MPGDAFGGRHQFDNGPLVLNDIAALVRTCQIDWAMLQAMAAAGGWQRGSAMLLRLTDHFHGPLAIPPVSLEPSPHDPGMLEAAAQLMLVDLRSSVDTHFRAGLQSGNSLRIKLDFLRSRAFPKRHALAAFAGLPLESRRVWLHYPVWLLARSRQRLLADGGPGQEEDRRNLQSINEWLRA